MTTNPSTYVQPSESSARTANTIHPMDIPVRVLKWWEKPLMAFARSSLGTWCYLNVFPTMDRILLRSSRGRVSMSIGQPIGLVTMTGAKSGQLRTVPLLCTPDGDHYILIGSNGGGEKHPAWVHNIRAEPNVELTIGGDTKPYLVQELLGAKRAVAWKKAAAFYPGYLDYQTQASARLLPVFMLERLAG